MWKLAAFGLGLVCLLVGDGSAGSQDLKLKNLRLCYRPIGIGATRTDSKFLPGDYLLITYEIDGIKIHDKTGRAKFLTHMEVINLKTNKKEFEKPIVSEVVPMLGGAKHSGLVDVFIGPKQAAGKYLVRVKVTDQLANKSDQFEHPFEVLEAGFGIIGVHASTLATPGQDYMAVFTLANLPLDAKGKPTVEIAMRILDSAGKVTSQPVLHSWPKEFPDDLDLKKENFAPVPLPINLNRAGSFWIEFEAHEKTANKKVSLRLPLTVLDPGVYGGK